MLRADSAGAGGIDKALKVAQILGLIAVPFLALWITNKLNASIRARETDVEMIKLAVEVLSAPAEGEQAGGLRKWAVDVLDRFSPVAISAAARMELESHGLGAFGAVQITRVSDDGRAIFKLMLVSVPGSRARAVVASASAETDEGLAQRSDQVLMESDLLEAPEVTLDAGGWRFTAIPIGGSWTTVSDPSQVTIAVERVP